MISFGVIDVGDFNDTSALSIGDVRVSALSAVPETLDAGADGRGAGVAGVAGAASQGLKTPRGVWSRSPSALSCIASKPTRLPRMESGA